MTELIEFARTRMNQRLFARFMRNDPADHAPTWHECGVLGHMQAVVKAAEMLRNSTGVDIARAATFHDIGKLTLFFGAVSRADRGEDPSPAYNGHEKSSAIYAARNGLRSEDVKAIEIHHWVYQGTSLNKIIGFLGDQLTIKRWLLLCAADACGKGWTEAQKIQRPEIARTMAEVADYARIEESDLVLNSAINAVESWKLVVSSQYQGGAQKVLQKG